MGADGPILVTGANGFVGRHLVDALAAEFPLRQIIAYGGPGGDAGLKLDVTSADACAAAVRGAAPDVIIHLAGQAAVVAATADPDGAMRVNAGGAAFLAEAALTHAPGALFLAVSSGEVYGDSLAGGRPTPESALLKPVSAYARSKAAAEEAIRRAVSRGLHAIIARPFNHTGPGQSETFVAPAFAAQIAAIESGAQPPVMRVGSLSEVRDFSDVRDIVRGYVTIARAGRGLPPGMAVNLASGHGLAIGDLLDTLRQMSPARFSVEPDPARQRASPLPAMVGDPSLAGRVLGWGNAVPLMQTLADVLDEARRRLRG